MTRSKTKGLKVELFNGVLEGDLLRKTEHYVLCVNPKPNYPLIIKRDLIKNVNDWIYTPVSGRVLKITDVPVESEVKPVDVDGMIDRFRPYLEEKFPLTMTHSDYLKCI